MTIAMREKALAAWHEQQASDLRKQAEDLLATRQKFRELLSAITGEQEFAILTTGNRMSAKLEGLIFKSEYKLCFKLLGLSEMDFGVRFYTQDCNGTLFSSELMFTAADFGRELARLAEIEEKKT